MARTQRLVADGIHFAEGPRWHDGRLWFSDFYAHRIYSVSEAGGDLRVELQLDGDEQSSGLGWMPDGSLLFVKMQAQELWRRRPDGRTERHADLSGIATFWCNDMVVDAEGRAYVGNFGFDLDAELSARGPESVLADHPTTPIVLVETDGTVRPAAGAERFSFPNGTVITPDGKTLVVGETLAARLTAFDIAQDGTLSNRRVWAETAPHIPDGICLDAEGAIWIADPLAPRCVRFAEGGEVLEVVETEGLNCYACMLGGAEGRTLFTLVAPSSHREHASTQKSGRIYACEVGAPRAGRP
ncbi:SMP-30/gluconolactonase/LRE family protein [Erythrobacter mangrovi]|uniref:SMP-30/gluconolactonase/LRE family protein n=1 Tax=Erythrobacter mangrovi TaxID=2739433 RepID=A0A7D4C2N0_9SPHN|nr:SMP-30/gluconolactonase/LRE family protein [Erythrobacter mangrovi]QKG70485.1 SMP-30/gluconolactonase/LRE family protein [Erythrobacter mangrovi]